MAVVDPALVGGLLVFAFGTVVFGIVGVGLAVDLQNRKRIRKHVAVDGGKISTIKRIMIATKRYYIPVHYEVSGVSRDGRSFRRLCRSNRRGIFWQSDDFASAILSLDGRTWEKSNG